MFYILTCGSTASIWLARALTRHPEIVCFHGVKTIAADPRPNPSEPLARQFVRELTNLYLRSGGECVFGAIHGFGAAEIAPEIAAIDGAFVAMIRHPITRLNSLFHREAENIGKLDLPRDDIYRPFRENETPRAKRNRKGSPSPCETGEYVRRFYNLCRSVFDEDKYILENLETPDIFRYEKIVSDREYFRACFERFAERCRHAMAVSTLARSAIGVSSLRLDCTQAYLDKVFATEGFNRKSAGAVEPDAIFANWPAVFKTIFSQQLELVGGNGAADRYEHFGYRLPDAAADASTSRSAVLVPIQPAESEPPAGQPEEPPTELSEEMEVPFDQLRTNLDIVTRHHSDIIRDFRNGQFTLPPSAVIGRTRESQGNVEIIRRAAAELRAAALAERHALVARIAELDADNAADRSAFAQQTSELQASFDAERIAAVARIRELEATGEADRVAFAQQTAESQMSFDAERAAAVARIGELETMLQAEYKAFVARIRELEATVETDRAAFALQTAETRRSFDTERAAAVARIGELETTLQAEYKAFVARIRELEATVETDRAAFARQTAETQGSFDAERGVAVARIAELETALQAEHKAFGTHIRELKAALRTDRAAFARQIAELQASLDAARGAAIPRIAEMEPVLNPEHRGFGVEIQELVSARL